jgi:cellobiose phosphorylase
MRDSSQDILAVMAAVPEEAREFLSTLLSFQKRDGSAMHQFNPLTLDGSQGDALEQEDRPPYYSDDHLWAALAVIAFIKETGELSLLERAIPFYEKDRQGQPLESASVLEHLQRAVAFTRQDLGAHGLPRAGFADWNDTINLRKGAESLFTANLYGKLLLDMIVLIEHLGDDRAAAETRAAYTEMQERVEACGWDGGASGEGEWYLRYFDADGSPLGSARNTYGQIYLNAQSWPVISGFASPARARRAMASAFQRLNTRYGLKLSTPGFNGYDPNYGGVTTYPPGAKENGGIFLHPNPWAMIAEAILGNGDRAYQYYTQINPALRNETIELYECEPYVYAQNVLGDEHPQFGLGRNSWLSGTAAWAYLAGTQWILGIRPDFDGLRIDPCIPAAWDGFSVRRRFRGNMYEIRVHNPQHVCKGVTRLLVDGQELEGNLVLADLPGDRHQVEAWLG